MLQEFLHNVQHNLFKPLLLFFYCGFLIPILKVKFEFPKPLYQSLTIYLLLAIGWHGGEELASLNPEELTQALGFMVVGFFTNFVIGIVAYFVLQWFTHLRNIDAATVAAYYGSDSAGTFVTCVGVLATAKIAYAAYMPVMLAVMEIPGCLVALFIIARLRGSGKMDPNGNMPGEPGYSMSAKARHPEHGAGGHGHGGHGDVPPNVSAAELEREVAAEDTIALRQHDKSEHPVPKKERSGIFSPALLHEVFLNPGIVLLFGGIVIGFVSRLQGTAVTASGDKLFYDLFQAILCLFLLEMGITASEKIKDLKAGGWQFVVFALVAPNVFATTGMLVAHAYSTAIGHPFEIGTYVLFGVLCGAASYIAVPAVQRMAIPEASPTLPLAASLGLTFSYNVTIGIPVYIMIAKLLTGGIS